MVWKAKPKTGEQKTMYGKFERLLGFYECDNDSHALIKQVESLIDVLEKDGLSPEIRIAYSGYEQGHYITDKTLDECIQECLEGMVLHQFNAGKITVWKAWGKSESGKTIKEIIDLIKECPTIRLSLKFEPIDRPQ